MKTQNYENHSTIYAPKTISHKTYYACVSLLNILALFNLCRALMIVNGRITAALFLLIAFSLLSGYFMFRSFSLKAQDRAIRAEENLRHFILTGKQLNNNLSIKQIVALRFAPDEEFLTLAEKAAKENLSNKQIKMAIKNWKADYHRA